VIALNELKKDIQWYEHNKSKLAWYEKELNALTVWSTWWDKTKEVASDIRWTTWWKVAILGAWALSLRWLFSGSDDEESANENKEQKKVPRYKKTWLKVAALLWIGGLLYYKWQDILDWIKSFWTENIEGKRDKIFTDIVKILWHPRSYDEGTNYLKYGESKFDINDLLKKWIIITDSKTIINQEETIKHLKEYVKDTNNLVVESQDTNNIEQTQEDLKVQENIKYYNQIVPQINKYGEKHKLGDATNQYEKFADQTIAPGLLIGHLDHTYGSIDAVLQNNSLQNIIDSGSTRWRESLAYYPKEILSAILKWLNVPLSAISSISNSQGIEDTKTQLARYSQFFENDKSEIAKKYRDAIIAKQSMIIAYLIDLRKSYSQKVNNDPSKMAIFSWSIADLIKKSQTDLELKTLLEHNEMDENLQEEYSDTITDKKKSLHKIDEAKTEQEKADIINDFSDILDDVWFVERSAAWDVMIGHVFETKEYIDMRVLEEMYGETFKQRRADILTLKNKNGKLTPEDITKFKSTVSDFYNTMHSIKTESHVLQETDDDGNLYTVWNFPISVLWKKILQSFVIRQDDQGMAMRPLVLWTFTALDLATVIPRKILFSKSTIKWRILRLSPMTWVAKKIGKWLFIYGWWQHLREKFNDARIRRTHQKIDKLWKFWEYYLKRIYKTPEDITKALKSWHISLEKAANIAYDRAGNGKLNSFLQKTSTKNIYDIFKVNDNSLDSMNKIKKALLKESYGMRLKDVQLDTLLKYFDHPELSKKLRNIDDIEKLLPLLKKWDVDGAVKLSKWFAVISTKEVQRLAWSVIEESKKWLTTSIETLNKEYKVFLKNGKLSTDKLAEYKTKLDKIMTSHNSTIYKQEKNILKQLKNLTIAERKALYESDKVIKNVVDANGGMKLLTATKRWRMMRIGLYAAMGTWQWWSALAEWKWKRYATKEVADFGLGMVPVAGDAYDVVMAARWIDLNGNTMTTSERWVRGWLWVVCWVVNVLSFWLGGTAIKWVVKWWTKLVAKAAAKEVTEVAVKITAKEVLAKWLTKEVLEKWVKQFGMKAAINGSMILWWLWIIEWADMMIKEEVIDDDPKLTPMQKPIITQQVA
jgi:hypothetical protein